MRFQVGSWAGSHPPGLEITKRAEIHRGVNKGTRKRPVIVDEPYEVMTVEIESLEQLMKLVSDRDVQLRSGSPYPLLLVDKRGGGFHQR